MLVITDTSQWLLTLCQESWWLSLAIKSGRGLHLRHLANSNSPPSGIGNQQISWPKIEIH